MSDPGAKLYCPSCGEQVETFIMLDESGESHHCFICGVKLDGGSGRSVKSLEMMLIAEDSMVFREVLTDKILELGLAGEVETANDGEEFIALFTRRLVRGQPVSLAVMDIRMPGMNGVNAAMAMRAIERGMERKRLVPILFFSSVRCDDTLRDVFKHCAPARYINKGNAASPEELSERLVEVINGLLAESGKK